MSPSNHIIIVAGEASGDAHAADLVLALKKKNPQLTFSGLGGARMREAGVEIYLDLTKHAVVGFFEVIRHYPFFHKAFHLIQQKILGIRPAAVILVDYPGFNLRLAKRLKADADAKVIYYISPQVWAWKKKRVHEIKKYVDKMLVIFKFEKDFYEKHGVEVDFVGHPLIEQIKIDKPKEVYCKLLGLSDYKLTIGLLPGSRDREIKTHLPLMLESAKILKREFPMMQFLLMKASTIPASLYESILNNYAIDGIKIVPENDYHNGLNACTCCIVASGTATLETAIMGKPMVIIYKTSLLTYILAKQFIKIPHIGLVNVVAGTDIVPECIQEKARPALIAKELKEIFTDESRMDEIKDNLIAVRKSLDSGGASERAAEAVLKDSGVQGAEKNGRKMGSILPK